VLKKSEFEIFVRFWAKFAFFALLPRRQVFKDFCICKVVNFTMNKAYYIPQIAGFLKYAHYILSRNY
jgi:hypothetical protein